MCIPLYGGSCIDQLPSSQHGRLKVQDMSHILVFAMTHSYGPRHTWARIFIAMQFENWYVLALRNVEDVMKAVQILDSKEHATYTIFQSWR